MIAQRKSCASSKTPPRLFFLASRNATKSRDCREFPFSKRFEILDSCDFWFDVRREWGIPSERQENANQKSPSEVSYKKKKRKNQGRAANAHPHLLRAHNFLKQSKNCLVLKKNPSCEQQMPPHLLGAAQFFETLKKFMPMPKIPKVDFCKNRSRTKNPQKWIFDGFWTDPGDFPTGRSRKRP